MTLRAKQTFFFLTSVLFLYVAADPHAPEVHTKLGSLRGQTLSVKGQENGVHAYLGIPFAKPPVDPALRLAAPQPVEGWEGVRDATKQPPMCVQYKKLTLDLLEKLGGMLVDLPDISEDCLYLNIYTPADRTPDAKLPVMVWIHGGGLAMGSASTYDGSALAAYQDMVVVLIQYRLGLLGFLSTGDEHMSGNFGMLDQVEALRWIQQHIHNFGGNPDVVTIFGESAGGVSVSLLLLSPLSDGLFHHAIAESGTAGMDLLVANDPLPVAQMVANMSGCSLESTQKIADCMRIVNVKTIEALGEDQTLRISVNVDGHFLRKTVDELFHTHELLTVPFMTGINNDEGGWMLAGVFAPPNWTEGIDKEHLMNSLYLFFPNPEEAIIRDLLLEEYIGTGEDRVKNRDGFTELLGDMIFNIPAIKTAIAHRDAGADVYLYEYHQEGQALLGVTTEMRSLQFSDCALQLPMSHYEPCTEEEEQLSRKMMSYWSNFARTGSPNGDGLAHWPKYGTGEEYLSIDLKEQVAGQHLREKRFVFLTQTLPEKIRQHKEKMERNEL
ncbi:Fatty acyl-CoA hydrolase precursor medium chain [Dissostichus eleginoides]|uniref:Carboxylic ester hydrolase n=1 Tax=Dissostichus eleginoides TaxID=100907 RepID=A0AAD9BNM2_DISEL|nr:Fatty acyl-CoA hydrolase precursor medium chain [Dissostichus eleginoides]